MKILSVFCTLAVSYAAIVGIDFGHLNTKAMMVAPGVPFEIIFTDDGKRKDPSAVFLRPTMKNGTLEDVERFYGSHAVSMCSRFPDSCAFSLKSLLGKTSDDAAVSEYLKRHPGSKLTTDEDQENALVFELGSGDDVHKVQLEELAAMSLADIKQRTLKALHSHPKARALAEDVAISVSPYAGQIARLAYLDVLHLARFSSVLGLVDESTAATLGFIYGKKFTAEDYLGKNVSHIIYDVGSGSTTATLFTYLVYKNGSVHVDVEAVAVDEVFGGELLTNRLYEILLQKFLSSFKLDSSFELTPRMAARLTEAAEKAKNILSANTESNVSIESFYDDRDFKALVTRQEFEDACSDLRDRAVKPILEALSNSVEGPKSVESIDSVILFGGATRTPFIQKQLLDLIQDENKIAKVLNTDEAGALGTTYRAFQLKMMSSSGTDISVKERIWSDFQVSVNGSSDTQVVFKKGSSAANTTTLCLGDALGNETSVELHENGVKFASVNLKNYAKRSADLTCPEENKKLFATFEIDANKIFTLEKVNIKCDPQPEFKFPEASTNGTDANSTNTTTLMPFFKTTARVAVPNLSYTKLAPLDYKQKSKIYQNTLFYNEKEAEKAALEHERNVLESACYSLRAFLDDHENLLFKDPGEDKVEEVRTIVGDTLEWLDYDSDDAKLEDLQEKLEVIEEAKKSMDHKVKIANSKLTADDLKNILKEGNELALQVQEYLLEFGTQINSIRENYTAEAFDFDADNQKILTKIFGVNKTQDFALDEHFSAFKTVLKKLSDLVSLDAKKFEKVTKQTIYEISEEVTSLIKVMMDDAKRLEKSHMQRVTYLIDRLSKLKERRKIREFKSKLKEEKKAAEEKTATLSPDPLSTATETTPTVDAQESGQATGKTPDEQDTQHDEL